MKKTFFLLIIFCIMLISKAATPDVFISEYIEGSSNNKAIELYNPTSSPIDLSSYSMKKGTNGADFSTNLALSGTIPAKGTYVIVHLSANASILAKANLTDSKSDIVNFNGNDAIGLFKNDVLIDVFGFTTGTTTITGWDVAGTALATLDHTLIRKSNISHGNTDWIASSGTTVDNSEWIVNAKDYADNLGTHTYIDLNVTTPILMSSTKDKSIYFNGENISIKNKINPNNNTIDSVVIFENNVRKSGYTNRADSLYTYLATNLEEGTHKFYISSFTKALAGRDSVSYIVYKLNEVSKLRDLCVSGNTALTNYVKYTGSAVVTFKQIDGVKKTIYAQDSTGAILIFDETNLSVNKLNPNQGDAITNIFGNFKKYYEHLEFIPVRDSGKVLSSSNTVAIKEVTFADYKTNFANYTSQLIKIKGVSFKSPGSTIAASKNYGFYLTSNTDTLTFRSSFGLSDYISKTLPTTAVDIIGLAAIYNTSGQIYCRTYSDLMGTTSIEKYTNDKKGSLFITPNPIESAFILNIDVEAKVTIYNLSGQKVKEITFIPGSLIDISDLTTGKYIVTTIFGNKAYSKIIVKK